MFTLDAKDFATFSNADGSFADIVGKRDPSVLIASMSTLRCAIFPWPPRSATVLSDPLPTLSVGVFFAVATLSVSACSSTSPSPVALFLVSCCAAVLVGNRGTDGPQPMSNPANN